MSELDEIKVLVLGNSAVGKSSIIVKYIDNKFSLNYMSTLGIDFKQKNIKLKNGKEISLRIFDTAGQERYKSVSFSFIKKADGIILMYDITNKSTFEAINDWIKNISEFGKENLSIVLVGNKCDKSEERAVSIEEGKEKSNEYKIPFFETSCKDGINVQETFDKIIEEILKKGSWSSSGDYQSLSNNGHKKGCC